MVRLCKRFYAQYPFQEKYAMHKRRLWYAEVLMIALLLSYCIPGESTSFIVYSIIATPIVSLIYVLYVRRTFSYRQNISHETITRCDRVLLEVSLYNKTYLYYPHIEICFFAQDKIMAKSCVTRHLCLDKKESMHFTMWIPCNKRGAYRVGIEKIYIQDILGIWKIPCNAVTPLWVNVLPKIVAIDCFPEDDRGEILAESKGRGDSQIGGISDIRRYQAGDSMKAIHWKLFAKQQVLWTRYSLEEPVNQLVIRMMNDDIGDQDIEICELLQDRMIEGTLGILNYAVRHSIQSTLLYSDKGIENRIEIGNEQDFLSAYIHLGQFGMESSSKLKEDEEKKYDDSKERIILVTKQLSHSMYEWIERYRIHTVVVQRAISTEEMRNVYKVCMKREIKCFVNDEELGIRPLME